MKYKYKTLQEQARENNNKILFILCQVVWRGGWNTFLLNVFNSMGYLRWGAKLFHAKEPEKEKLILKIAILVLKMLLICVCHFSCSSTVTPSSQCFETCSAGMVSDFRFKGSCFFSGVFVSLPSACILFSSDSVPSDFCNTIHRERECVLPCFCVWSKGLGCGIRTLLPSLGLQSSTLTSHHWSLQTQKQNPSTVWIDFIVNPTYLHLMFVFCVFLLL